jgi:hypothetical protein
MMVSTIKHDVFLTVVSKTNYKHSLIHFLSFIFSFFYLTKQVIITMVVKQ